MYEYSTSLSYGIPCIITYILWTSQVLNQSNILEKKTYDQYYAPKIAVDFFRYMYCWVNGDNNIFGIHQHQITWMAMNSRETS